MKKAGKKAALRRPAARNPERGAAVRGDAAARSGPRVAVAKSRPKIAVSPESRLKRRIQTLRAGLAAAQAKIDELQAWADTDFLLNIYNRRGFERELHRSVAYIKRYRARGALIVLDVDGLKPINDTFGHAAGDLVLKGVVAVLMRHVRSSDVVGRLGGDEFGLLLWNLTEADARVKAAALEDAIDRLTFVFKGRSVVAGASAGIALLGPMEDAAVAMEQADRAMYARKAARKGRALAL